jgi:hypothetical protein
MFICVRPDRIAPLLAGLTQTVNYAGVEHQFFAKRTTQCWDLRKVSLEIVKLYKTPTKVSSSPSEAIFQGFSDSRLARVCVQDLMVGLRKASIVTFQFHISQTMAIVIVDNLLRFFFEDFNATVVHNSISRVCGCRPMGRRK